MVLVNGQFLKLPESYLFSDIAGKVKKFSAANPDKKIIRLGIGDVTRPLPKVCIDAMHKAVDEMACESTFRGYGPEQGYEFLVNAILENDYASRGVHFSKEEIFINDGAKSDTGNIGDILDSVNRVAVTDPVYPVYVDSNVMGGRGGERCKDGHWNRITYLPCISENGFIPALPNDKIDVIYLCFPNNPTGTTLTVDELSKWVRYALDNKTLLLFDSAYEAFIREENVPHSIYEIDGAERCAIEFRSFSKTAGFTGVRCGYTVVPKKLVAFTGNGEEVYLNRLWNRRQCTKFNGTSYITQRAAEAIYTSEGKRQVREIIDYYMGNAEIMRIGFKTAGFDVYGGVNAPYLWVKTPDSLDSWQFFEAMLEETGVVSTPGVGFGPCGEGYIRLSAFGKREDCEEAIQRIKRMRNGF